MWFSHYALVCFTLASISVAEPVKYDPRESATVDQLGLKEGLVYLVRRRVMALTYFESNHVPVVYLGPLPDYKMIAFVLVLETRERLPKKFHKRAVKELFPEKIPSAFEKHNIDTVGVNMKYPRMAIAEELERDKRENDDDHARAKLTDSIFETARKTMNDKFYIWDRSGRWDWDWTRMDLGQKPVVNGEPKKGDKKEKKEKDPYRITKP